jgi:molecular chaperone GrpE
MDEQDRDREKLEQERDEYLEGWKRTKADFANYKKEEAERMARMADLAEHEFLKKVFPILDNIQRAVQLIPEDEKENQVYKGLLQIASQWKNFLKQYEIKEIETVGKPFNPEFHEAIGEVDAEDGDPSMGSGPWESGIVAEELEKGYMVHERLLRPAKVRVIK